MISMQHIIHTARRLRRWSSTGDAAARVHVSITAFDHSRRVRPLEQIAGVFPAERASGDLKLPIFASAGTWEPAARPFKSP